MYVCSVCLFGLIFPTKPVIRNRSCPRFGVGSMGEEKNWIANMELDNEGQEGVLVVLHNLHDFPTKPVEIGFCFGGKFPIAFLWG